MGVDGGRNWKMSLDWCVRYNAMVRRDEIDWVVEVWRVKRQIGGDCMLYRE